MIKGDLSGKEKYKKLFTPGKINGLQLKNRIVMPPMDYLYNWPTGESSDKHIELYARRARGGPGLIICGPMITEKGPAQSFFASPYTILNPRLYDLVEAVKINGSQISAALSPIPINWTISQSPHEDLPMDVGEEIIYNTLHIYNRLTTAEVEETISQFARVAGWMKGIGFDAIEINMSFYPDYFTLEHCNKRTDKYGGDLEGRLRFHKELIQSTRSEVGPDFPIMIMMDIDQFTPGWRTLEDSKVIVKKFEEWGADSIRTRSGTSIAVEFDIVPYYFPKGYTSYLAAGIKEVLSSMTVIANARLADPDVAEKVLEEGKADFVGIGRGLLADPELPNKIRSGRADHVRKCISCCNCYDYIVKYPARGARCTVNPILGNEEKFRHGVPPAEEKGKVVIVGSGPAGMSAALTAAQRGHDVVLFEKTGQLGGGGQFKLSTIPPFKQENLYIPEYYEKEFSELKNVETIFNTEANAERVMQEKPDAVIIATGASATIPDMPGATDPEVLTYAEALLEEKLAENDILIVGGGQVGCEVAHYLLSKGKQVTILEMLPRLADEVTRPIRHRLIHELTEGGAEMIPGARVTFISGKKVNYVKDGQQLSIDGDKVVLALGAKAENQLYEDLRDKILNLHLIGDAKKPRYIVDAIIEGFNTSYYL
jgi:2,4-dienoyl-CoA reductase (NADPH2)